MNKRSLFLFLFFAAFSFAAHAQEDTTGKGALDMPVVTDQAPKIDSTNYMIFIKDSLKRAALKADSLKMDEDEKEFVKETIKDLCTKGMHGRGYIKNGWDSAAKYVLKKFKTFGLQPVVPNGPYAQGFAFPVNTFPGKMELFINGDSLAPGRTFLIEPASTGYMMDSGQADIHVKRMKLGKVKDTAAWAKKLASIDSGKAYYLTGLDDAAENLELRRDQMLRQLPRGIYIVPEDKKLAWAQRREPMAATVFYVKEDSLPKKVKKVRVLANQVYNPHQRSENVIACVPGEIKDTFVVFSAHYDHLGSMGEKTVFPGAGDNASGTAMMLYLASYFSKHPQHYSILFIAFGAEELSLMGSEFFAWHPFVPLSNIKFLANIGPVGDATNGITVVNAGQNAAAFETLTKINDKEKYLRVIYPRDNAANSDHYYLAKKRVPSIFLYSNGGNGYTHDIYDVKTQLSLNHVQGIARLLIDFTSALQDINTALPMPEAKAPDAPTVTPPPADGSTPPPAEGPSTTPAPTDGPSTTPAPDAPTTPPKEEGPSTPPKDEEPTPAPQQDPGK